jgi:uncharacterized protein YecE (DUF72 family)
MKRGLVRIGISGWTYAPWRGVFYPPGLPRQHELHFAADHFPTIEVNGTFYGLPRRDLYCIWRSQVAADFVFAVSGPRLITHGLRLKDAGPALAAFMASGILALGANLGPILWRFPANFPFDPKRISAFLAMLPRDTEQAAALIVHHDRQLKAQPWAISDQHRKLRHAFAVRHNSFLTPLFLDMLRAHNAALVCTDAPDGPQAMDVTADFLYCRLRGPPNPCPGGYDDQALRGWVQRAKAWAAGDEPPDAARIGPKARHRHRDVFIFLDNDCKVRAPANALELIRRMRA